MRSSHPPVRRDRVRGIAQAHWAAPPKAGRRCVECNPGGQRLAVMIRVIQMSPKRSRDTGRLVDESNREGCGTATTRDLGSERSVRSQTPHLWT